MQINRLFEMVYILLDKKKVTAGELARRFEVSPRTIYRDAELLSSAGIPVYMTKGKGGGISLLPDFVLNKAVLTDRERSDILSALHAVEAVSLEQANTAVQKLSSLFGGQSVDWLEVDFSDWSNGNEESKLFSALKAAILVKQRVAFFYHGSEGGRRRTVEPLKLCFKGQSWYLYAYCMLRKDFRFFKLRRIKEWLLLEEHFERRAPAKIFGEGKAFQADFVTVTLKISNEMAYRVYDEFSEYEKLTDGDFRVTFSMPQSDWLYQYLATFGEHCEVLAPEDVRRELRDKLQKALEQYK
ncbi:MAG: YafY family protein [Clostridia bacterium]